MFVLLQIYSLEAVGDDDPTPLDAIAVDGSQERLEEYLAGYQEHYRAACAEFAARDPNPDGDWTSEHDCLSEALMDQHCVDVQDRRSARAGIGIKSSVGRVRRIT